MEKSLFYISGKTKGMDMKAYWDRTKVIQKWWSYHEAIIQASSVTISMTAAILDNPVWSYRGLLLHWMTG